MAGRIGAGTAHTHTLSRTSGPGTPWSKVTTPSQKNAALTDKAVQLGRQRSDARSAISMGKSGAWLVASAALGNVRSATPIASHRPSRRTGALPASKPAVQQAPAQTMIPMRGPRMGGKAASPVQQPATREAASPLLTPDQELARLLGDDHASIDPEQILAKYEQPERTMRQSEVKIGSSELGRATLKFRSTRVEDQ